MEPYLGEIRLVGFNFAPRGWAACEGQLLPIAQNQALFSLLGTTYGGDGRQTFALPDLRGRIPMGVGPGFAQGARGGSESVTLNEAQMPAHAHGISASGAAGASAAPVGGVVPAVTREATYAPAGPAAPMAPTGLAGGGQPHDNMSPFLAMQYIIATVGLFPPRN